jgi:hypothetical protein
MKIGMGYHYRARYGLLRQIPPRAFAEIWLTDDQDHVVRLV